MATRHDARTLEELQGSWISGHLYYHQGLDPVVQGFAHPLASALARERLIDAFFFVRDWLGGPHVRLRLRVVPGAAEPAVDAMQLAARRFLDLRPSTHPLDEEAIHRSNRRILAADPHELDDAVYLDNSFRLVPFRPEIERYGGADRFRLSLDFFTLSSVAAVELLSRCGDLPRSAQLAHAFCLLLEQALGFAADETELIDLLRYGVDSWGKALPKVVDKGDKMADSQREAFLELVRKSLTEARSWRAGSGLGAAAAGFLVAGAGRLSAALATADRPTRARIGGSQLHMTATRLGLGNAEEVYLSRLLTLTLRAARDVGADLSWLSEPAPLPAEDPGVALGRLLSPALAALAALPVRQEAFSPPA